MKPFLLTFLFFLWINGVVSQMVGYVHLREAMIWVQTPKSAKVKIVYWDKTTPKQRHETETLTTQRIAGYTAHLICDGLEPGRTYEYQIWTNGKVEKKPYPLFFHTPPLWQYRFEPPAIKVAVGSCAFVADSIYDRPGKPYGGDYGIFTQIYKQKPDAMIWLGDNMYLREVDWYSKSGFNHRYTHQRQLPELKPLLANTPNLAIWDDHDYGPNDSDRSFVGKEIARAAFQDFWANPTYGSKGEGIASMWEWIDVQFFLTDDRWFRSPNDMQTAKRTYFGAEQLNLLVEALISSKASFKFVCVGGQVLNDVAKYENLIQIAPDERAELLDRIAKENIQNVIFLTGDRHHSELSKIELKNPKGNPVVVYDWTVSPLTSTPHDAINEANTLRVPDSHYAQRNFGTIEITGNRKNRQLLLQLWNSNGEPVWKYLIEDQK